MQSALAGEVSNSINRSRSAPAATLRAMASNYHAATVAATAVANALHRQCSNVSTSSEYNYDDSPTGTAGTADSAAHSHLHTGCWKDRSPQFKCISLC